MLVILRQMESFITSNCFSSSNNFWSLSVCASSTIWLKLVACVSKVLKKFTVIWEIDCVVSIALECACTSNVGVRLMASVVFEINKLLTR